MSFADINADGRADHLSLDTFTGAVQAWLNGGPSPSGGQWIWWPQGQITGGFGNVPAGQQKLTYFAEVNGDGRTDYGRRELIDQHAFIVNIT